MAGKYLLYLSSLALTLSLTACSNSYNSNVPLLIQEQGVFSAGGSTVGDTKNFNPYKPAAKDMTIHGDHATVFYQIPMHAHKLPLIFLHGAGQSMRTWQTTPDGREGMQNILLKNNYAVYLVDQPRRGQSGRTTIATEISDKGEDQL